MPARTREALEAERVSRFVADKARSLHIPRQRVQTLMLMDRILNQLAIADHGGWLAHGSATIFARSVAGARVPKDIDIYSTRSSTPGDAAAALRRALETPDASGSSFTVVRSTTNDYGGKLLVEGVVAGFLQQVGIDVRGLSGRLVSQPPEMLPPILDTSTINVRAGHFAVIPISDQAAEKADGMLQPHAKLWPHGISQRYKDVADLLGLMRGSRSDANAVQAVLHDRAAGRSQPLPKKYVPPSADPSKSREAREQWRQGVNTALKKAGFGSLTCEEAEAELATFIGPVLDGTAVGIWDPELKGWDGSALANETAALDQLSQPSKTIGAPDAGIQIR